MQVLIPELYYEIETCGWITFGRIFQIMNAIAVIILVAIVSEFALHLVADRLNLARLTDKLPEPFQGITDADHYRKSQDYLRVNTKFGWITSAFSLLLFLLFWFGKGFPMLDQWVRSWGLGPIPTGLLYFGSLLLLRALLMEPFNIYSTFVIEERFGFNRTTRRTYILDLIKGIVLSIAIGGPLLAGILAFFEYFGPGAWWYCWIIVVLYTLVVQFVAPNWIMPWFNKFEPIEDGELKERIFSYAKSIRFPLKNVCVMDGSRRSEKSNAFFTGFGKNRRIVLYDTLIAKHTVSELMAVLAHEMGHYQKKHILKSMVIGWFQVGILFFLFSLFISQPSLFEAFYMEQQSVYAGVIFFGMLFSPLVFFLGLFMQIYSRKIEYEADRFAVETTGDPQSMANALKKLSVHNLSNLTPHPFYVFLNYSHPPVLDRLRAILPESA